LQGDAIDIEDLAEAWYAYVAESGELNFVHQGPVRGQLIEAMVFTTEKLAALGLAPDSLPQGAWVGYHLPDAADYQLMKAQGFFMFSIRRHWGEGALLIMPTKLRKLKITRVAVCNQGANYDEASGAGRIFCCSNPPHRTRTTRTSVPMTTAQTQTARPMGARSIKT
jgi:hypothetical protein